MSEQEYLMEEMKKFLGSQWDKLKERNIPLDVSTKEEYVEKGIKEWKECSLDFKEKVYEPSEEELNMIQNTDDHIKKTKSVDLDEKVLIDSMIILKTHDKDKNFECFIENDNVVIQKGLNKISIPIENLKDLMKSLVELGVESLIQNTNTKYSRNKHISF